MMYDSICRKCGMNCICDEPVVRALGRPETDPKIVEYLEHMLNRARAGEVTSFACVAVLTSRRTIRQHVVGETGLEQSALVGLLETVKIAVAGAQVDG